MDYLLTTNYELNLNNKHGIAIAKELVFFLHCFFISLHDKVMATKSTSHHQQDGFR